ncbi:hypothetical protein G4B88_000152 [Cannabis sativa]|uniref:Reverse transcriptase zinc-binding domain-containing protein n=1 Tax=Cannabis sativa TaxID=3483 RepID=A0A7J6GKN0_CANSA|nr:hypothetical protein G4B88_000152 [Cannabis sativa]
MDPYFVLWTAIQDRLRTRERLKQFNIIAEDHCLLCWQQPETKTLFLLPLFSTIVVGLDDGVNRSEWDTKMDRALKTKSIQERSIVCCYGCACIPGMEIEERPAVEFKGAERDTSDLPD